MKQAKDLYRFLEEGHYPFDGGHDVFTRRQVVEPMMKRIDLTGTFLVMLNVEFVISLVYTYNINTKNIKFYSDSMNKTKFVNRMGVVNVITELDKDMKFDVIVSNPPYQHPTNGRWKLWIEFIKKSFSVVSEGGIIAMITPSAWINAYDTPSGGELFTAKKMISEKEIVAYKDINQEVFNVGEKLGWFVVKNLNSDNTAFFESKKTLAELIVDKTSGNDYKFVCRLTQLSDQDDNGKLTCYHSAANRFKVNHHKKNSEQNGPKMIVNRSGYYVVEVFDPSVIAGRHSSAIMFDTIAQAELARNTFQSKLFRFVNMATKTGGFNKIDLLPNVDLSKSWSDSELYAHFGLNQEEIDYIEANVK
jgi:hypothetical protein